MAELRTHYLLPSRFTRFFGDTFLAVMWSAAPILVGFGFLYSHRYVAGGCLLALSAIMSFLTLRPTTVVAGSDGIEIRWLGMSCFIPYAELAQVERHAKYKMQSERRVETSRGVLVLHDRGGIYLICDDDAARDLIAAVEQGSAKHQRAADAGLTTIRRGDLELPDWMKKLRGLLGHQQGYRDRATTADELWAVVENPKTKPADRAAAAFALRAHLGDEAEPRLRIAIVSCASPKLRVALEAIAADDERTTSESLANLTTRS